MKDNKLAISFTIQYCLIPLTFIFNSVAATINYSFMKDKQKKTTTGLIGFTIGAIFWLIIPSIVANNVGQELLNSDACKTPRIIYMYATSVPASLFFIWDQKRYLMQKSSLNSIKRTD